MHMERDAYKKIEAIVSDSLLPLRMRDEVCYKV